MSFPHLLAPAKLGDLSLRHKVWMAPLTRARADANHAPTDLNVEYYSQRASDAAVIITEATMVQGGHSAFGGSEPGLYSEEQVQQWKKVVDAVHAKGAVIVAQIWHGGRACHSSFSQGNPIVSSTTKRIENDYTHTAKGKVEYEHPRAITTHEVPFYVEQYRIAAENAKKAGFDGVEIHGANGYLIDQFLRDGVNDRKDKYGQNRLLFLEEVIDAVLTVFPANRVGLRISPLNSYNDMKDSDPVGLTEAIAKKVEEKKLAFFDVMRGDFFGVQKGDVLGAARKHYKSGLLLGNMGYTAEEAEEAIKAGSIDAVVIGKPFIANPDYVERIKKGIPLAEADPSKFYGGGADGYTSYPRAA